MGYQTFPWTKGDSESYKKLIALQLPNLKGKSFLDLGCNEGFFCGYATFLGAKKVTGIDINPQFLEFARAYFPQCEFLCQSWDNLPDEKYDVILNASAIHYARDQKKFIDLLVDKLEPGGILALEIGVAPGDKNEFVEVKRSIDSRFFPTHAKLADMLKDYAWKYIGPSVNQAGDPVPRQVYHISRKLPYAILALDDPFSGKTFTVNSIFRESIKRISGDQLYYQVAHGEIQAPAAIAEIVRKFDMPLDCGRISNDICLRPRLFNEFCLWLARLGKNQDFILDMYLPPSVRQSVAQALEAAGYFVVYMNLQKASSHPRREEMAPRGSCYHYMKYLRAEYMIDEKEYLEANPDVAAALREGRITSAMAHYIFCGRKEGRKRSLKNS